MDLLKLKENGYLTYTKKKIKLLLNQIIKYIKVSL